MANSIISDKIGGGIINDGTILVYAEDLLLDPLESENVGYALNFLNGDGEVYIGGHRPPRYTPEGTYTVRLPYVSPNVKTKLTQNIVIGEGVILTSGVGDNFFGNASEGKTAKIMKGGILDFGGSTGISQVKLINEGTIRTGTDTPEFLLKGIFEWADKGRIEAKGKINPQKYLDVDPEYDGNFIIPEGFKLIINKDSSNLARLPIPGDPAKDPVGDPAGGTVEVRGQLILGESLTMPNKIEVKESGVIDLDIYTLTLSPSMRLSLPGLKNVMGRDRSAKIIADETGNNRPEIYIDNKGPYSTFRFGPDDPKNGVYVSELKSILDIFNEDYKLLTDSVTLDSRFGSNIKGIGAVQLLDNINFYPITMTPDGASPGDELRLKSKIEGTKAGFVPEGELIEDLVNITVSTDASNKVQISDDRYEKTTANQKYVVLRYNSVRLLYGNLYSPRVDEFRIGVRTNRK
jgi:hypothetical protein